MCKAVHPEQGDLFRVASSKGEAARSRDEQRKLRATLHPVQRKSAAFVERAEKAKVLLKESLAALTAAQKSLMNGVFKE